MEYKLKMFVLTVIKNGGNIDTLIKAGMYYSEVGEYCNLLVEQHLIDREGKTYFLTNEGSKILTNYFKAIKENGCEKFILEYPKYIKTKKNINDVYIPKKM